MPDVWLFGEFYCTNRLNTDDTRDHKKAKWRSQVKVPQESLIINAFGNGALMFLEFDSSWRSYLVYLKDLEYQLRDTSPKPDDRRIRHTNTSSRTTASNYLWFRFVSKVEYQIPLVVVANPNTNPNTNPSPFVKPVPTPKPLIDLGYLNFVEERLELGFDYGAVGGMAFETEIVEVASDREQRNALRYLPLGRWQLGERTLLESEVEAIQEVSYLKDFHTARRGSFEGFRFKDWSDYQALNQLIAVGDGTKTQFQLRKAYSVGGAEFYRPIIKPVASTFLPASDFMPPGFQIGVSLDSATGIVTLSAPLPVGALLFASFEFDVPVWFESDQIGFSLQGYDIDTDEAIYKLESLFVVEGRIPIENWTAQPSQQIEKPLDLGIIYETVEQYEFSTAKQELKSGYVKRDSKRLGSRKFINLGSRIYDKLELEQILSYFWLASGRLNPFPFKNLDQIFTVRFEQDQLSLKFEGASKDEEGKVEERLFSLPGLKLQVVETPGLLKYISGQTTVYFCLDSSGTIDYAIPAIQSAIADWQQFLTDNNYDLNFVQLDYSHERWLKVVNDNFAPNALYLIWSTEAAPFYHSTLTFTPAAADFETDKDNFIDTYDQRNFCKIIVHSLSLNGSAFDIFNGQLFAAKEGVLGYSPPLENYGLDIKVTIDPDANAFEWLEYFKTEQLATNFVGAGGAPFDGLLKYVNRDTQIYFCLDTSGSIDYSLPAITAAIADWKTFLGNVYYGSDWVDTHTQTVNYTHERWLKVPTDNFNANALYLIWSSEAAPFYHSTTSFSPAAADFLTDRTNFLASFATRQSCKIIVHSLSLYGSDFTVFNGQLEAAKEGTSGYSPALKNYGLDAKVTINPDTSAAQWLNYFKTEAIANDFAGIGGVPPVVFPSTGLSRYYRLESLSPINDSVGNSTLSFKNGQTGVLVPGKNGQAIFFDSGAKGFGGVPLRTSQTSVSVSLWYKTANAANGKVIFTDFTTANSVTSGNVRASIQQNSVELWCNHQFGQSSFTQGTKLINDNQFHHLVFVYDGSPPGSQIKPTKLYIDGVFQPTLNYNQTDYLLNLPSNFNSFPLYFNVFSNTGLGADNSTFDEIGIWNVALNAAQIADLYNNGAGTFY